MLRVSGSALRRRLFVGVWVVVVVISMTGWAAAIAWLAYKAIGVLGA
jgi:hypothetical protein